MLQIIKAALITDIDDRLIGIEQKFLCLYNSTILNIGGYRAVRFFFKDVAKMVAVNKKGVLQYFQCDGLHVVTVNIPDDLLDQ